MKPNTSKKNIVPKYWPVVEGVQEDENSGSLVLEWKVMDPIEWAEEDMSSMGAGDEEVDECEVKSAIVVACPSLSLCRGRRRRKLGIS